MLLLQLLFFSLSILLLQLSSLLLSQLLLLPLFGLSRLLLVQRLPRPSPPPRLRRRCLDLDLDRFSALARSLALDFVDGG